MGWHERCPRYREEPRLGKRLVWYKKEACEAWPGEEAEP
jgi:hypothetical protein